MDDGATLIGLSQLPGLATSCSTPEQGSVGETGWDQCPFATLDSWSRALAHPAHMAEAAPQIRAPPLIPVAAYLPL